MSALVKAELLNIIVLAVLLARDLGPRRKVGRFRIIGPLITGLTLPLSFPERVSTQGNGLALELAGVAAGVLVSLLALARMRVYRNPETGKVASAAGLGYALIYTVAIGARAAFSYGADHWFAGQLGRWLAVNSIPMGTLTNAIVFMAGAMLLTRSIGLAVRAGSVKGEDAARSAPAPRPFRS
jgi:hypothetical protein